MTNLQYNLLRLPQNNQARLVLQYVGLEDLVPRRQHPPLSLSDPPGGNCGPGEGDQGLISLGGVPACSQRLTAHSW